MYLIYSLDDARKLEVDCVNKTKRTALRSHTNINDYKHLVLLYNGKYSESSKGETMSRLVVDDLSGLIRSRRRRE